MPEPPATTGFSSSGPLPPVAGSPAQAGAPTASDQAFGPHTGQQSGQQDGQPPQQHDGLLGKIGEGFVDAGKHIEVIGAEAVGVAELAGLRYPVKAYEAQVDGGLYRGSRVDAAGMQALKQQGIVGIVNLCMENNNDAAPAAQLGLKALHIPILDNSAPSIAQMQQFVAFARANPPTYVHCEAGEGRTGTAVACYRIAVDGWTADAAIAEGQKYGLQLINQINFIRHFEAVTRGTTPAGPATDGEDAPATEARPGAEPKAEAAREPTAV